LMGHVFVCMSIRLFLHVQISVSSSVDHSFSLLKWIGGLNCQSGESEGPCRSDCGTMPVCRIVTRTCACCSSSISFSSQFSSRGLQCCSKSAIEICIISKSVSESDSVMI
jgi:hypothetical protein